MEGAGKQIKLRPVRGTSPLSKEQGVWIFYAGQSLSADTTDEVLQQVRAKRDQGESRQEQMKYQGARLRATG